MNNLAAIRQDPGITAVSRNQDAFRSTIGVWIFLSTVTMLFAAFTSSYLIRKASADWQEIVPPPILWLNTLVLIGSSVSLVLAQRALLQSVLNTFRRHLVMSCLLGVGFLIGQVACWVHLTDQGIVLPTNPHSSFFFILTGLHGLHLFGGLVALVYATVKSRTADFVRIGHVVRASALYWHFMAGLWLYVLVVLFIF